MSLKVGEGEIKLLENDPENPLDYQIFADFFPDGKRIIFSVNKTGCGRYIYIQNIDGANPSALRPMKKSRCYPRIRFRLTADMRY